MTHVIDRLYLISDGILAPEIPCHMCVYNAIGDAFWVYNDRICMMDV